MFNINQLKRDKTKAREGVVVKAGGGLEITVVCMNDSAPYKEMMMREGKSIRRGAKRNQVDSVALEKLQAKAVAEHILKDWNLSDKEDKAIAFTKQAALKIFIEAPEFLEIVVEEASNYENFRMIEDEDLGNSATS